MIAGVSRGPGSPLGLTAEDRAAMALVSRECLRSGLPDHGSEIHELLWLCTRPLGEWLKVPAVLDAGLAETRLLLEEDGIPPDIILRAPMLLLGQPFATLST